MTDQYERFGNYILTMRLSAGVSREQLCQGLCSDTMMRRFEQGERLPDKMLRDRLLMRLGESSDVYENYVDIDEYIEWKHRYQILENIVSGWQTEAEELLDWYRRECDMSNPLQRQFVLAMEAQLLRKRGAGEQKLLAVFEEAVKLTVPAVDDRRIAELCLSMQELNLVLEYLHYKRPKDLQERYRELMDYILSAPMDTVCRAKSYPKAVYYLCLELEKEAGITQYAQMLKLCNCAIEMLRDAGGMYYLWELLMLRKNTAQKLTEEWEKRGDSRKAKALQGILQETEEWQSAIDAVQREFHLSAATTDYCYLYVEKEVYCIGDVIRTRREMLGMTKQQLCEGICSLKTMGRIERNQVKTQRQIVRELFEKLGLSREYQRTELVTTSPAAKKKLDELRWCINEREYETADKLIAELKEIVPMDIPTNRQALRRYELLSEYQKGSLAKAEYILRVRDTLEYTIPYKTVVKNGYKYVTHEEIGCILNLMNRIDRDTPELAECVNVLHAFYEYFEQEKCVGAHVNMYETVMTAVASQLGNKGEYDRSDEISRIVIAECFKWHRMIYIPNAIYNLTWNYEQRVKGHIPVDEKRNLLKDLEVCIIVSRFLKLKFRERSYREKMNQRKESKIICQNLCR